MPWAGPSRYCALAVLSAVVFAATTSQTLLVAGRVGFSLDWGMTPHSASASAACCRARIQRQLGKARQGCDKAGCLHLAICLSVSMVRSSLTMKMRSKRDRMVDCRSMLSWADLRSSYLHTPRASCTCLYITAIKALSTTWEQQAGYLQDS